MIRRDPAREPGRHRDGQVHTPVHRRLWDGPARAEAERLGQAWPNWCVLYSLGLRRFHAIATWPAPEPLMVEADTPEGLETRMREAETAFAQGTPPANDHDGATPQASATPRPPREPYRSIA